MFLTVHASVGAVLGDQFENPNVAGIVGFASHFVLDAIPHGDERIGAWLIAPGHTFWVGVLFLLDIITAFAILSLFFVSGLLHNPIAAFTGALGAVLPDVLVGFSELKQKFFPDFKAFHNAAHLLLKNPVSPVTGYFVQVVTFWFAWSLVALRF